MQSINDTYQRITDTIVKQLEAGTKPWIRPWRNDIRCSLTPRRATGEAYRGINVLMLWISSQIFGYEENTWMTYRQAQDLGAKVRKGEKGTLVVKYGTFTPKEREDDEDCSIPYLKGYTVFNVEQIENLPARFFSPADELPRAPVPHIETVETFVKNTGASVTYGGTKACYRPNCDDILMPDRHRFDSQVHLYSTLLHEIGHYAVSRIMPHGRLSRRRRLHSAMRRFGIIRAIQGTQAVRRWDDTAQDGLLVWRPERAPFP
ncbi:DUF1738 domain-containing protein [Sinorhizobium medicae]|uniref:ArdC family protein n=1 Tax=Sinorhizobium medicae TaxID=110321 RepID=UPI000402DD9E|nr:ArdC-like ssDNA-binding domain-containing protein [Sinorhizobium medicae]MDX0409043.1 DUF1738 domain-containing protein [Sinorhizobium medicae]MDX0421039.1 DUF1738 domain-containing protein [Sinorhizobium medicae]MDX0562243.1 DUF1738 domain-containing protein [Sinorhizobium medicae]MDX0623371.1 DUF1738 domain-containing protein [Sinorhizobium medicae]MDX0654606.1 DUF1738 domain-containing protein [Sinorhizobium medicae]